MQPNNRTQQTSNSRLKSAPEAGSSAMDASAQPLAHTATTPASRKRASVLMIAGDALRRSTLAKRVSPKLRVWLGKVSDLALRMREGLKAGEPRP